MKLILPGDPRYITTLASSWQELSNLPKALSDWEDKQACTVGPVGWVVSAETGWLRPASPRELEEYLLGGEYDQRLGEIEAQETTEGVLSDEEVLWLGL